MRLFSRQPPSCKSGSRRHSRRQPRPSLRFTPTAWAKLLFLRDLGETEVGGFGISAADDLLLVEEFVLVPQVCSAVTVAFGDAAVADFFDQQIDLGRSPERFGRIWIHTHPGDSARPSTVDDETFVRVFGRSDWAVMAILACGGQSYSRLRFPAGPGGSMTLPMELDFLTPFAASDHEQWTQEYLACVTAAPSSSCFADFFTPSELFSEEASPPRRAPDWRSTAVPPSPHMERP